MHFQRKRSERGASLIMLVAIIGLAFIVTVAGFLVAASDSQDTARLASAKVDIATREDALMREILQQTATGMLPATAGITGLPLTWTQIMTTAVNNLYATSYATTAELAGLKAAGAIPANVTLANTGDTGGALLGIFQGYNNEIPYGGTSGLANLVPVNAALAAVEPPLMNWSASGTLTAATALTTPQEFFLGSLYTGSSPPLSASKRWGSITYPNIRFGYKQPNEVFIARRAWWRIPLVYQTAQQTVEDQVGANPIYRYPSVPANYVLSVYEIPSQLPISGNANLQIGDNADGTVWVFGANGVSITGSIYASQIQLAGGTYNNNVSSRQAVNVLNPSTVGGTAYSNSNFDNVGTREQMALTQPAGVAAPLSVAGNDGKVLVVPVMPGNQFYMTAPGGAGTETHWDLYARPYYRCRIRIIISGTNSTLIYNPNASPQMSAAANAGAITVNVNFLPDSLGQPDQILGFLDSATTPATNCPTSSPYTQISYGDPNSNLPPWLTYTSTGSTGSTPARNILVINVGAMVTALGSPPSQLYSIYIGSNPTAEPPLIPPSTSPGIAITGANDLHAFTNGLSIVSNQTLYLLDAFNQVATQYATSIFAPDVRYGISGITPASTTIIGQVSVDQASPLTTPTPGSPLQFLDASGNKISTSTNTFTLSEITSALPTQMPPITRLTLLFTIERERTN